MPQPSPRRPRSRLCSKVRARAPTPMGTPAVLERYRDGPPRNPRSYPDLHEHLLTLAQAGLLTIVDEPINKDTEMHPLVRWQYRGGIAEADRKAFLFTQPTDCKGRRFDIAVLVAGMAANRAVYRIGFGKPLEEIGPTWVKAIAEPIAPRLVADAPYLSAGHYITRDPETGIQNVGNYRGQLKAPRRLGMNPSVELSAGIFAHWEKR